MDLAFRGARTDGAPADQIGDVLGRDHVQELAGGRHAQAVDVDQQLPRNAQALVDAVALVQVGIVDQPLPAHGGARLFEVHAHHDLQRVLVLLAYGRQAARVLDGGRRIVDGAGADDDQQAVILASHDVVDGAAGIADQGFDGRTADGEEANEVLGRGNTVMSLIRASSVWPVFWEPPRYQESAREA